MSILTLIVVPLLGHYCLCIDALWFPLYHIYIYIYIVYTKYGNHAVSQRNKRMNRQPTAHPYNPLPNPPKTLFSALRQILLHQALVLRLNLSLCINLFSSYHSTNFHFMQTRHRALWCSNCIKWCSSDCLLFTFIFMLKCTILKVFRRP